MSMDQSEELTIKDRIALALMPGLLARSTVGTSDNEVTKDVIRRAYQLAELVEDYRRYVAVCIAA
jgi:hypothetical protein